MDVSENKKIMASNIKYYMEKNNLTRQDLCNALGVKYTTLTEWIKGNSYPRIDKIELMANYFGISKSDLVEYRHSVVLDELSSCPFCGKRPYLEGYGNHWWARCGHCGALGPTRIGERAAVEFWNTRKG